jgi:hypothetical protein
MLDTRYLCLQTGQNVIENRVSNIEYHAALTELLTSVLLHRLLRASIYLSNATPVIGTNRTPVICLVV